MKLNQEEAEEVGRVRYTCPKCGQGVVKQYCGRCDEFYNVCGCKSEGRDDHRNC